MSQATRKARRGKSGKGSTSCLPAWSAASQTTTAPRPSAFAWDASSSSIPFSRQRTDRLVAFREPRANAGDATAERITPNPQGASAPALPGFSTASSTATASYNVSDGVTTSGTSTAGTGLSTSTTSTVTETDSINQSAFLQAASPGGFSPRQSNVGGEFFTGSVTYGEVDQDNGPNRFGTASLTYDDRSSETDSYSYLATTDTTPASSDPVYQYSESRSLTSSTTDTGNYVMNPPGVSSQPTADNPDGAYASLNDTRRDNASLTASVSEHVVAGGPSASEVRDYQASRNSSLSSNRTVTVVGATGTDTASGSYTRTGYKEELSQWSGQAGTGGGSRGFGSN
jgi:hypothetical protein